MEFGSFMFLFGWKWVLASIAVIALWGAQRIAFIQTRPGLRHLLWLAVLIGFLFPCVPIPILPSSHVDVETADAELATAVEEIAPMSVTDTTGLIQLPDLYPAGSQAKPAISSEPFGVSAFAWSFGSILVVAWALISAAMLAISVRVFARHRRAIGLLPTEPRWDRLCEELAPLLGINPKARPNVCVIEGIKTPALFAGARPAVIVIPASIDREASEADIKQIIGHELAHYSRLDHWCNLLGFFATCVLWWNPLVWLARRNLSEAAEICCDAIVIDRLSYSRKRYAEMLWRVIDAADSKPGDVPMVVSMFNDNRFISRRFEMISNQDIHAMTKGSQRVLAGSLLVILTLLPVRGQNASSDNELANDAAKTNAERIDRPWVGHWNASFVASRLNEDTESHKGAIVFGFEPGASAQRGKVIEGDDGGWSDFVYRVESAPSKTDELGVPIVLFFDVSNGADFVMSGRFRLLKTGHATFVLEEPIAHNHGVKRIDLTLDASLPVSFAQDHPLAPQGTAGRPWVGLWRVSVNVPENEHAPKRSETGYMAFAYDPSKFAQQVYLRLNSESEWQVFDYRVMRPSFDGNSYELTIDFRPGAVPCTLRFGAGHATATITFDEGYGLNMIEEYSWTKDIRKMELSAEDGRKHLELTASLRDFLRSGGADFPKSVTVYSTGVPGPPAPTSTAAPPVFHGTSPIVPVPLGSESFTSYPPYAPVIPAGAVPGSFTPASKQPHAPVLELDKEVKRLSVFVQSHREISVNDILSLIPMPPKDPNKHFQKVATPSRVKVVATHGQNGPNADVSFVVIEPGADPLEGPVHAQVEHGIEHDEITRRAGDTAELAGRWRLEHVNRADGFAVDILGTIEAEVIGDVWKVYVDGKYQSSKIVTVDSVPSPSHLTLIQRHRGTGEPTIHRGIFRVNGEVLEVFYSFDPSIRPSFDARALLQEDTPSIRQRWVKVQPTAERSKD